MAKCGVKVPLKEATLARFFDKEKDTIAPRISGLFRCGSPWTCPVCGPRLAVRRANTLKPQIDAILYKGDPDDPLDDTDRSTGWTAWLLTLTIRHERGDDLGDLFELLRRGWNRLISGKGWKLLQARAGGIEYVRGYDFTWSPAAGWHPHIHCVFLFGPDAGTGAKLAEEVLRRWRAALKAVGGQALRQGLDAQPAANAAAAAAYAMSIAGVSKKKTGDDDDGVEVDGKTRSLGGRGISFAGVAEATASALKKGNGKTGRTAGDLLAEAVGADDEDGGNTFAAGLWLQYARFTKGKRAVNVSKGLSLTPDEDLIEDESEIDPELVAFLREHGVKQLDPHMPRILSATKRSKEEGQAVLRELLGPPLDEVVGSARRAAGWRLPKEGEKAIRDDEAMKEALRQAMDRPARNDKDALTMDDFDGEDDEGPISPAPAREDNPKMSAHMRAVRERLYAPFPWADALPSRSPPG